MNKKLKNIEMYLNMYQNIFKMLCTKKKYGKFNKNFKYLLLFVKFVNIL